MLKIVKIFPIIFRSIRLSVETLTISRVIPPSSYIFRSISLVKRAMPLSLTIHKTTNISRRVRIAKSSVAMFQVILPLTIVLSPSIKVISSSTVHFIITPSSYISILIRKNHLTLTLSQLAFELTFIHSWVLIDFFSFVVWSNSSSTLDIWPILLLSASGLTCLWSINGWFSGIFFHLSERIFI